MTWPEEGLVSMEPRLDSKVDSTGGINMPFWILMKPKIRNDSYKFYEGVNQYLCKRRKRGILKENFS